MLLEVVMEDAKMDKLQPKTLYILRPLTFIVPLS